MKKRILFSLLCASLVTGFAHKSEAFFDWNFRAPSVSDPDSIDPKTEGDIVYDTTSDRFYGWNGGWIELGGNAVPSLVVSSKTANYTLSSTDDLVLVDGTSGSFSLTLPTAVGISGKVFEMKRTDNTLANPISILTTSSQTIDGATSRKLATQNEAWKIVSDGSNWQVLDHRTATPTVDAGAVTIGGTTTAPTKGTATIVVDRTLWSRSGDKAIIQMSFHKTSSGTATVGSGDYLFTLPSGLSINTTLTGNSATASGTGPNSTCTSSPGSYYGINGNQATSGYVCIYDATKVVATGTNHGSASNSWGTVGSGYQGVTANLEISYNLYFTVPISGWDP